MENKLPEKDLFGNDIVKDVLLRDKFIEPPFSVLDTKSGHWQKRKRLWMARGIKSEVGRDAETFKNVVGTNTYFSKRVNASGGVTSIFDPALTELIYHWFCPEG